MSDFGDNRLKKLSTEALQNIIAKAISAEIDEEVQVVISSIAYDPSDIQTKGTYVVHVQPEVKFG